MPDLTQRLLDLGYTELFERADDRARSELWKERPALLRIALDPDADPRARFLAAEIVLSKDPEAFDDAERLDVGAVYTRAMRDHFAIAGNAWSFPNGPYGGSGERLLRLGRAAVPALSELLDDTTPVGYEGSREASAAALWKFRLKDLAALFLSRITGLPFAATTDPHARDTAIAELKRSLAHWTERGS
jgi:hypothetical protein